MSEKYVVVKELYRNINTYEGKEVSVSGWVRTIRDSKNFAFIEINDRKFLQKCTSCF